MRIIVCIKQVPETKSVKMDEETGTLIRDGVKSIVNPLDLYAIETALELSLQYGGDVVAISMGPSKAKEALREAMSMGIDSAVLISDSVFAASDTWATSYILSEAIKRLGDYSLVICGERATDGDTGQVGPGIAAFLELPVLSYVSRVSSLNDSTCKVDRLLEDGYEGLSCELPAVLTVVKEISDPRLPTLRGKQRARRAEIPVWDNEELGIDTKKIGLKGSPTRVVKIARPKVARQCRTVMAKDDDGVIDAVVELEKFLVDKERI